jgi:diguanylate cyclase
LWSLGSSGLPQGKSSTPLKVGGNGIAHVFSSLGHLTDGLVESHFHFFVIVPLLTLYGDWSVFLLAIGYVAVHHGVFAQLDPTAVFNHPQAWRQSWKWALIHAVYVPVQGPLH